MSIRPRFVLRVELIYRAAPGCPLRPLTHLPNGKLRPAWTVFQHVQQSRFCTWESPLELPHPSMNPEESSVFALEARTGNLHQLLGEKELAACAGDLRTFLEGLRCSLNFVSKKKSALTLHRSYVPFYRPPFLV